MNEITRIVRLSFQHQNVADFIKIFNESKSFIRNFEGCLHLELKRDFHHENVYFTVSKWKNHDSLENYRHSELFKTTWAKTKILFDTKAVAFSIMDTGY